jgi:hypothetical protein
MEENLLHDGLMYKEMIKFSPAKMPTVSPEAKNGLGLDHLAHIRSIAPVPFSPFRSHGPAV